MKKKSLILVLVLSLLILTSCKNSDSPNNETEAENKSKDLEKEGDKDTTVEEPKAEEDDVSKNVDFLSEISYSNISDDGVKDELSKSLVAAGLSSEDVEAFLTEVQKYNDTVGDVGLTSGGFVSSDNLNPSYDVIKIDENWLAKNPEFAGYNCRMTAFLLAGDLIKVENPSDELSSILFMDNESISYSENPKFTDENINKFNTIFAGIPAELTKDVDKHIEEVKAHMEKSKISFKDVDASLISFYIHSDLDNILFIGHTGILVPSAVGNYLLFVEKLSFQEPYQVLKFQNRRELNDYLMNKYDNWVPTETARPFIMENDHILEGYRLNPNTK